MKDIMKWRRNKGKVAKGEFARTKAEGSEFLAAWKVWSYNDRIADVLTRYGVVQRDRADFFNGFPPGYNPSPQTPSELTQRQALHPDRLLGRLKSIRPARTSELCGTLYGRSLAFCISVTPLARIPKRFVQEHWKPIKNECSPRGDNKNLIYPAEFTCELPER